MRRDDHLVELRAPDRDALRIEPSEAGCRARSDPRLPLQRRSDSEVAQRSRRLGAEQPPCLGRQDHRSGRLAADAEVLLERCDPPEPGEADAKRPRGAATRTSADRPPVLKRPDALIDGAPLRVGGSRHGEVLAFDACSWGYGSTRPTDMRLRGPAGIRILARSRHPGACAVAEAEACLVPRVRHPDGCRHLSAIRGAKWVPGNASRCSVGRKPPVRRVADPFGTQRSPVQIRPTRRFPSSEGL
jgi:hypothetical protein